MADRVLFVDDDPKILSAFQRVLRNRVNIRTAAGPLAGLKAMKSDGPFAVVVSDQQMPELPGIEFLRKVEEIDPHAVRIMLTGNADQKTATDAINQGHVFRFLNKPCTPERLGDVIDAALAHHRAAMAERELLEHTLAGSVKTLTDVLALLDPNAFRQTTRIRKWASAMAKALGLRSSWELDLAVMLCGIGPVTLPREISAKMHAGEPLSEQEKDLVARTPAIARNLIANIPRMKRVGDIIYYQDKNYDGSGYPNDLVSRDAIPIESRILHLLKELAKICPEGDPSGLALGTLAGIQGAFDPRLLDAAREAFLPTDGSGSANEFEVLTVGVHQLFPGFRILDEIRTMSGVLVLAPDTQLNAALIERITQYHRLTQIKEPIRISRAKPVPADNAAAGEAEGATGKS